MRYDKKENTIRLYFLKAFLSNSPILQYLNFSFHRHFKERKKKGKQVVFINSLIV